MTLKLSEIKNFYKEIEINDFIESMHQIITIKIDIFIKNMGKYA